MAEKVSVIRDRSKEMIERGKGRVAMQNAMLKMYRMDWDMDSRLAALTWIRKEVSSDPHDAVRAGTRVFSSLKPSLKITPLKPDKINRDRTDELERGLMWELDLTFKRKGRPLAEILKQALLYDMICMQVSDVGNQAKVMKSNKSSKRIKNAKRLGRFVVTMRNPQNVYADFSDLGLERVLYRTIQPLHEVTAFWGKAADKLKKGRKNKHEHHDYVTVYDYHDFDTRHVWGYLQGDDKTVTEVSDTGAITILKEDNKLDFLPWVIKTGGDELTPLLYSVHQANQWDDQNVLMTMVMSEAVSMFAGPRYKKKGPGEVTVDYGEPGRIVDVPQGTELEEMVPPPMDANLLELMSQVRQAISKGTVPDVITTGAVPSGAAFATLDLQTRSGIKALTPYRDLAADAVAEIFRQMIYWLDFTGKSIFTYPVVTQRVGDIEDVGGEVPEEFAGQLDERIPAPMSVEISANDFDVEHLYIEVELKEDIAQDRLQRTSAAIMQHRDLKIPLELAYDGLGIEDAGYTMELWEQEQDLAQEREIERFKLQSEAQRVEQIKNIKAEGMAQLQIQEQAQNIQQQAQEQALAQQEAQAQQQALEQQGQGVNDLFSSQQRASGPGFEAAQGPGFDPSRGGSPPALSFPDATREQQAEQRAATVATQAEQGGA